jgi:cellulose biosynthesis protein BcsQ
MKKLGRVIALASGKGGVGKSTLALALADVWVADGHRVAEFSRHRYLRTLTLYDDNQSDLAGSVATVVAGLA